MYITLVADVNIANADPFNDRLSPTFGSAALAARALFQTRRPAKNGLKKKIRKIKTNSTLLIFLPYIKHTEHGAKKQVW